MLSKIKKRFEGPHHFKKRIVLFAIALFIPYSISYAAFKSNLSGRGEIDILVMQSDIVVTDVSSPTIYKSVTELSDPSYEANVVSFSVELSNTNSSITYEITVQNEGSSNARYDTTTITSNNDAFEFILDGLDSSTILEPGESITFQVTIRFTEEYEYNFPTSKSCSVSLEFVFQPTLRSRLIALTGYIAEDEGDVSATPLGAPITVTLTNSNAFAVSFMLKNANNFIITDQNGEEKSYTLSANQTRTYNLYIKDLENAVAVGLNAEIFVTASMTDYDVTQSVLIDSITLTLPRKGRFQLLANGYSEVSGEVDYTQVVTSGGSIYLGSGLDDQNTYYYRGVISNNYFSFADRLWRILRIDESANIRLISNELLSDESGSTITQPFYNSNSASSLEAAYSLVRLINDASSTTDNSPIYGYLNDTSTTTIRGWYNNTIADTEWETYMVDSVFCQDIEGGTATSSGTSSSVYYFGPYQKIGVDTGLNAPTFECHASNRITDKIGLLNVDEFVFAGGAYRVQNSKFFLNDSGIGTNWWTMSPGYYDSTQAKVGVFYVDTSGSTSDWPNANTTKNSYGLRPVITVSGNYELFGTGTSDDPYRFTE